MQLTSAAVTLSLAAIAATPALAQTTLDAPRGEFQVLLLDSGERRNAAPRSAILFDEVVRVDGAGWVRLHFGPVELSPGSYIRVTSALDGEVQELDAETMSMWSNASAFFNGDSVRVELVAAPGTLRNRVLIDEVLFETGAIGGEGGGGVAGDPCGVCNGDDRVLSFEEWSGRLLPSGCTASVWNEVSCLVSAGHCINGNSAVGFNVPPSQPGCVVVQPPVADQFPLVTTQWVNAGVGADWAVMTTGTNNLGQTIYDRYGVFRPIAAAPATIGTSLSVWGYGLDDGTECYTQQTSSGTLNGDSGSYYTHDVDTTFGNSGSGILRNGEIVAIATHCGCPSNVGTRVDVPAFAAARDALCDFGPANDDCSAATLVGVGSQSFSTVDALTDGFDESGSCGITPLEDVWFRHFAPCDGDLTITVSGSDYDVATTVYRSFVCPTGVNEADECLAGDGTITMSVTAGQGVRIRVGSGDGSEGTGMLTIDCTPLPCAEDCANDDGNVDINDLLALLSEWGGPGGCDVDGSGKVDINDLLDLLAAWGIPC